MADAVPDAETAVEIATEYADEECLGELGEVLRAAEEESLWVVEFLTHALAESYEHRVRIASTGKVVTHDRTTCES